MEPRVIATRGGGVACSTWATARARSPTRQGDPVSGRSIGSTSERGYQGHQPHRQDRDLSNVADSLYLDDPLQHFGGLHVVADL